MMIHTDLEAGDQCWEIVKNFGFDVWYLHRLVNFNLDLSTNIFQTSKTENSTMIESCHFVENITKHNICKMQLL